MKNENGNRTEAPLGWTSLEQSRRLESCGLDVKSADMHWEQVSDGLGEPWEWKAFCKKDVAIEQNLFSHRNGYSSRIQ